MGARRARGAITSSRLAANWWATCKVQIRLARWAAGRRRRNARLLAAHQSYVHDAEGLLIVERVNLLAGIVSMQFRWGYWRCKFAAFSAPTLLFVNSRGSCWCCDHYWHKARLITGGGLFQPKRLAKGRTAAFLVIKKEERKENTRNNMWCWFSFSSICSASLNENDPQGRQLILASNFFVSLTSEMFLKQLAFVK